MRSVAALDHHWRARSAARPLARAPVSPAAVIFAVALIARLAWALLRPPVLTWDDEREFVAVARHLAAGDGYVSTSYRANPILPLYLAGVFRLVGENLLVARAGQAAIGAATCVLAAGLGSALAGPAVGVLAGLWLAVYPPHVYLASVFYVDCLLTFLFLASLCLAARTQAEPRAGLALATGVLVGLTVLTRALYVVCVPVIALAWIAGTATSWRRRAGLVGLLVLGTALAIAPWSVRNRLAYGRIVPVSSGFGTKLWQGNTILADGGPADRDLIWGTADWNDRLARLDPATRRNVTDRYAAVAARVDARTREIGDQWLALDEILLPQIVAEMRADPLRVLGLVPRKLVTFYSAFSATSTENADTTARNRTVARVAFYPVLGLALVGVLLALPRWRRFLLAYLAVSAVTAAYAALNVCTRFRLPLDPLLIVFAAFALVRAREGLLRRRELREEKEAVHGRGRAESASG